MSKMHGTMATLLQVLLAAGLVMALSDIKSLSVDQFVEVLRDEGYDDSVVQNFADNKISGGAFLKLKEHHLKELVPIIGVRLSIGELLEKAKKDADCEEIVDASYRAVETAREVNKDHEPKKQVTKTRLNWHLAFEVPDQDKFSDHVQKAIETGIVLPRSRREIVQMLRTLMLQFTKEPTPEEYGTICSKLVLKYNKLQDDSKSGYGTWKESLRTAFKNFRRPDDESSRNKSSTGESSSKSKPPSSKRFKLDQSSQTITDEEFDESLESLRVEFTKSKKSRNQAEIKRLMDLTFDRRRLWITQERPLVNDIVKKFPPLKSSKSLRREFRQLMNLEGRLTIMETWSEWEQKIMAYAKMDSAFRPTIKEILAQLESEQDQEDIIFPEDWRCALVLELVKKVLFPKGPPKGDVFVKIFENYDLNLEVEITKFAQATPYIVVVGDVGKENTQYFISCETVLVESKSYVEAVTDLIVTYYVYDISYPKGLMPLYIFLQHYVMGLKDGQAVPNTTIKLISNLKKIDPC